MKLLEKRSEDGPDRVGALCVLGERTYAAGHADLATAAYAKAHQLDPSSLRALAGWISARMDSYSPGKTEEALRQLALAEPESPAPKLALGELYLGVEDLPHAEPYLREAARSLPEDSHVRFRYGNWLALRGLRGKAVDELTKAAQLAPKVPEYRIALVDLLVLQGRNEEAASHLKVAKSLAPDSASLQFYEAKLLLARQDDSASAIQAEACLRRAQEMAPQWPAPRMLLASQAMSHGKPDVAITELENVRSIESDNTQALVALAQAYHRAGRSAEGRKTQQAYERSQREARVMNDLMNAALAAPKDVKLKLRLARALRAKGVLLSALAYYRDTLLLDPNQSEAREAVDALIS